MSRELAVTMEDLSYLSDVGELRPLYKPPSELVRAKQIDRLEVSAPAA